MTTENTGTTLPTPNLTLIQSDYDRVLSTIGNEEIIGIGRRIDAGTASANEVLRWFKYQDPLEEKLIRNSVARTETTMLEDYNFLFNRARIYEKAARIYMTQRGLADDNFVLTEDVDEKLKNGQLGLEKMRDLLLGTEIFSAAGRDSQLALYYEMLPAYGSDAYKKQFSELRDRAEQSGIVTYGNTAKIFEGILGNTEIDDRQILTLALEALVIHVGEIGLSETMPKDKILEIRKRILHTMMNYFNEFLFNRHLLENWDESHRKGKLLELLWPLDAYFYLTMEKRYSAYVVPSLSYEDSPSVGYPDLNRGVDVWAFDPDNNIDLPIQLKSSTGGRIHDSIQVLMHPDFEDYEPGKLKEKFASYKRALDSDFSDEDKADALMHILPSVIDVFSGRFNTNGNSRFRRAIGLGEDEFANNLGILKPHDFTLG